MRVLKKDIYVFVFFVLYSVLLALYFANRDIYAVQDSLNYKNHFENLTSFSSFRYEYFFDFFTYFIRLFTNNYVVYFFILNFTLNCLIYLFCLRVSKAVEVNKYSYIILVFFGLLLSSWYVSFSGNIVRHGLSIMLLYLSIYEIFFNYKRIGGYFYLLMAIFTHYTVLLVIPFLFLINFNLIYLIIFVSFAIFLYVTGYNEFFLKLISEVSGLGIYDQIKYYSESGESFSYGFSWVFLIYTLGLSLFYLIFYRFFFKNNSFLVLIKTFFALSCVLYIMGFAGYPNRYGVFSWGLSIFINSIILLRVVQTNQNLYLITALLLFIISSLKFFIGSYL